MSGEIVILTGPPGSGKSTTARALAAHSDRPAVRLHADDFWDYIESGRIEPWRPEAHAQNTVVMDAVASAAQIYAAGGYLVVVDGIVGPWFLGPFRALAAPQRYVVLRPSLEVTLARAMGRAEGAMREPAPITSLHRQFCDLGALERHAIDTSSHSPGESLQAVRRAIAGDDFRLG